MAKRVLAVSRLNASVFLAPRAVDAKGQSGLCFQTPTCGYSFNILYRCHRLKRPCHPADALRRSAKKQSSSDARIAKLEGTLGQLVSLLQAGNVNVGTMNNVHGNGVYVWLYSSSSNQCCNHTNNIDDSHPLPSFHTQTRSQKGPKRVALWRTRMPLLWTDPTTILMLTSLMYLVLGGQ